MKPVSGSTSVAAMKYKEGILQVMYMSGDAYDYQPVPQKVYDEIQASSSIGSALHRLVKANVPKLYTCSKVEASVAVVCDKCGLTLSLKDQKWLHPKGSKCKESK